MTNPLISVIIPAYNRAYYVRQAVKSVLEQTHRCCEVILVDDGSTDDTRQVLTPLMDRIHYLYQENQGLSAARNRGLSVVQGDFVAFLDADDYLLPNAFELELRCFQEQPALGAVNSAWRLVNQQGETLFDAKPWSKAPRLNLETWVLSTPFFLGAMLFRQEWVHRTGLYDKNLRQAEDVDYVLRMASLGCKFGWLRCSTVCYRQHDDNMTRNGLEQVQNIEVMWNKFFARSDLPPSIRQIEHQVRYYRDVWYAWRVYFTGFPDEVEPYLKRALSYMPHPPTDSTVIEWARMFSGWFQRSGADPGDFRAMMPFVYRVIPIEHEKQLELTVDFLSAGGKNKRRLFDLSDYVGMSSEELVDKAQANLVLIPVGSMIPVIEDFWDGIVAGEMIRDTHRHDVVVLYLTAFGQSVLAGCWAVSRQALQRTLRHSFYPGGVAAWFRFIRKALDYFFFPKSGNLFGRG